MLQQHQRTPLAFPYSVAGGLYLATTITSQEVVVIAAKNAALGVEQDLRSRSKLSEMSNVQTPRDRPVGGDPGGAGDEL